jgi:hypothetical protein
MRYGIDPDGGDRLSLVKAMQERRAMAMNEANAPVHYELSSALR